MATGQETRRIVGGRLGLVRQQRLVLTPERGLTFVVTFCGHEIGTAHFVPVGQLPRLQRFEHSGEYPLALIDHGALEPLAAYEIGRMLAGGPDEHAAAIAAGFADVPASGAGRPGAPRQSDATVAVLARRALAERHRLNVHQKQLGRARERGLYARDDPTSRGQAILAAVDAAKECLLQLLADAPTLEVEEFLPHVIEFGVEQVNAAVEDFVAERRISVSASDPELRGLSGSRYARISLR